MRQPVNDSIHYPKNSAISWNLAVTELTKDQLMKPWVENKDNYGRQYMYENILALEDERKTARDHPFKQAVDKNPTATQLQQLRHGKTGSTR